MLLYLTSNDLDRPLANTTAVKSIVKDDHLPILRENEDANYQSGFKIHIHDPIEPNFIKVRGQMRSNWVTQGQVGSKSGQTYVLGIRIWRCSRKTDNGFDTGTAGHISTATLGCL